MIRKIAIFSIAAFVVLWIAGAHLVKGRVIFLIKARESDNIKFAYEDIKASGFPFAWRVKIISPKFTVTDQIKSTDIAFEQMIIAFNYSLTKAVVDFGHKVNLSDLTESKPASYELVSDGSKLLMNINFNKSIYFLGSNLNWRDIRSLAINLPDMAGWQNEKQIFTVSDANLVFDRVQEGALENVNIKIGGDYKGKKDFFKFQSANIEVDLDYMSNNNTQQDNKSGILFERLLKINKGYLAFDKSSISLAGTINFNRDKLPAGDISVAMTRYSDLLNQISPPGFMLAQLPIKKIITRIAKHQAESDSSFDNNNLKFKIKFSDEGINVGDIKLLDMK